MYAVVMNIRFSPAMSAEVVRVAQGFLPILRKRRGFEGLQVLTDAQAGEGIIVSIWQTKSDAQESEANASYINQLSMLSSFLYEPLVPRTYTVSVRA